MTSNFINRVIEERIVDTDKYRFIADNEGIKRLPIEWLGTTKSLTGWSLVYSWN